MFALGNTTFSGGVRSTSKWSFEEARGETEVEDTYWCRSHAHCCRWRWRRGHAAPVCKPNPNSNQRPLRALFCLKLDNSCCYAHYSCGNDCNVVVKLVQEYHCCLIHFTSILQKQFATNNTFLREANSYNRALTLRNSLLFSL